MTPAAGVVRTTNWRSPPRWLGVEDPPRWSDRRYDRIWRIERSAGRATLRDLPQGLLPGDSCG